MGEFGTDFKEVAAELDETVVFSIPSEEVFGVGSVGRGVGSVVESYYCGCCQESLIWELVMVGVGVGVVLGGCGCRGS